MLGGEGNMIRRMPVLSQDHGFEFCGELVYEWHNGVAIAHGQGAAGAKIVLNVDNQQSRVFVHAVSIGDLRPGYRQGAQKSCKAPPFKDVGGWVMVHPAV